MITLDSVTETNSVCNGLKKSHLSKALGSIYSPPYHEFGVCICYLHVSSQLFKEARKGFKPHARAQTHASAEWLKISTPEVKSCVKSS